MGADEAPGADAFGEHAPDYARAWEADPIALVMRAEVHRALARWLPAGASVLDAGCGIGTDAAWLQARGHEVLAIDRSAGMVAQARAAGLDARVLPVEEVERLGRRFDAALLDFGVINCVDPAAAGAALARVIAPGGLLFLVTMPRLHPTWLLARLRRGDLAGVRARLAPRRFVPVGQGQVDTRYWSAPALARALAPAFRPVDQRGLGFLLPPPGSRGGAGLDRIERPLRGLPLLRELGDHVLLVLRRTEAAPDPARSAPPRWRRRLRLPAARTAGEVRDLRVLILDLTHGCNSRCLACDFRGPAGGEALDAAAVARLARQARAMGCGEALLTGGEPLLRPDLEEILRTLRLHGLRTTLLSNGLALKRHAVLVARWCDEVVISLDGHDRDSYRAARGVDGLDAVRAGVEALRQQAPGLVLRARVTVSRVNAGHLVQIGRLAVELGLSQVSYLAPDVHSIDAFGRAVLPAEVLPEPQALRAELAGLRAALPPGFLSDSDTALDRIWQKIAADLGQGARHAPRCDAPWTSVVVGPDLALRPCFFIAGQGPGAHARDDLRAGLSRMAGQLRSIRVEEDPVCQRCVCWARLG